MRLVCPECGIGLKVPDTFERGKCPKCKGGIGVADKRPEGGIPVLVWALVGGGAFLALGTLVGLGIFLAAAGWNAPHPSANDLAAVDPAKPVDIPKATGGHKPSEEQGGEDELDRLIGRNHGEPPAEPKDLKPREPLKPEQPLERLRFDEASFLGVQAKGKRFCIIADCSGSMMGNAIEELKVEMVRTLRDLDPSREFYVIFFHTTSIPMPHPTWLTASKENLDTVVPWVTKIRAQGGTQPSMSFQQAFNLQPRPDIIFFMTDGLIPPDVPTRVAKLNQAEPKVVIHTIMFTRNPQSIGMAGKKQLTPQQLQAITQSTKTRAEPPLRMIAEQSGGTFRHVTEKGEPIR